MSLYSSCSRLLLTREERIVLCNPDTEYFRLSGISQLRLSCYSQPDPIPRDPQKARIGDVTKIPSNGKGFDRFLHVNMQRPELNDRNGLLGYMVHAHCWVLLDRVIGHALIKGNLKIFVDAIQNFWMKNRALWNHMQFDYNYDDPFYSARKHLRETSQFTGCPCRGRPRIEHECEIDPIRYVDMTKNPVIVPEIQSLINRAVRDHSKDDVLRRPQQAIVFDIPLEIAMMTVNIMYNDIYYSQASIDDLRNMLTAFRWKLPDSYWKRRCKKDLIFEVDDLIRSRNQTIDWQFLCLGIEELLLTDGWYDNGGLKNCGRTLKLLKGLKGVFLKMISQQDDV